MWPWNHKYYTSFSLQANTWLQGIHKSFCKYHKWYVNQSTYCDYKNPYSVFYEGDQEEEEEEGENQDEDEEYYEEQC